MTAWTLEKKSKNAAMARVIARAINAGFFEETAPTRDRQDDGERNSERFQ
jgi:hypothetical protein